ncbi:HNH endonuclease [Paenibacillus silvisoli]|uniref:HNH endonuclease n=1 Tax=Paenibacillus silvisoli TaxID=3110539 RepID=UPI00280504A1|nr:HNH endonuclease [Paenibacillus silvisoli]
MTLKELVQSEILNEVKGIDINRIKILRHAEKNEKAYKIYDLYKQGMFDFYQCVQSKRRFDDCDYILSFIGGIGSSATFVGAYEVGPRDDFDKNKYKDKIPAGFPIDEAFTKESYNHYELKKIDFLNSKKDKLVVDWVICNQWDLWLGKNDKEIISLEGGYLEIQMDDEEEGYSEGKEFYRSHIMRERKPEVIKRAKERFIKKHGKLFCEVCGFDFYGVYGERGKDYIEGHHKKLVSQMKEGDKTKASDIAMLCSNCHRMIHRKPIVSVEELAQVINKNIVKSVPSRGIIKQ